MMDQITTDDLDVLLTTTDGLMISLYLPTERRGPETRQNPIRFRKAVDEAVRELENRGVRSPDARSALAPAAALVDDHDFWQHQEDGLAVFVAHGDIRRFRLPSDVPSLVVVGERFHVKPLLPVVSAGGEFYVLAISHDHVRLLRGTRYRVSELDLGDVPTSLAEALWYKDPEAALQHHSTGAGGTAAAFHGHGLTKDSSQADLKDFFRAVDKGVASVIGDRSVPVVLAGVDYLLPLYREVSSLEVLAEGISGNPDEVPARDLHREAWPLVAGLFDARRIDARDRFMAEATPTLDDVTAVVPAAGEGRVESLFVPGDEHRWGSVDADTFAATAAERGPTDLYDAAAALTWRNGGRVYVVDADDVPGDGEVAAILRY